MDDIELRTVLLEYPSEQPSERKSLSSRPREIDLWITMLEQTLASDFDGYETSISIDLYSVTAKASIIFATIEDATLFRLQHAR